MFFRFLEFIRYKINGDKKKDVFIYISSYSFFFIFVSLSGYFILFLFGLDFVLEILIIICVLFNNFFDLLFMWCLFGNILNLVKIN